MSNTVQNTSAVSTSSVDENRNEAGLLPGTTILEMVQFPTGISDDNTSSANNTPKTIKQFQPLRFTVGLCCTSFGVALIWA